jgi:protein Tex
MSALYTLIAQELGAKPTQVAAAAGLLDEGATVPFVARYRKEVTGGLDDTQLRHLAERLDYLRELDARRQSILKSIEEQGKLDPALRQALLAAQTKTHLEELYLPFKPKRRSKALLAREAGLAPLAEQLLQQPTQTPEQLAEAFIDPQKGIHSTQEALDGAKHILLETFSESAVLLDRLRHYQRHEGLVYSQVVPSKQAEAAKFQDYFDYTEAYKKIPSHRALALFRGRKEGFLTVGFAQPQASDRWHPCEAMIADFFAIADKGRPADAWLCDLVKISWRQKIAQYIETDLLGQLRESAENSAIEVFARNLKDLLLAAPAGQKATLGLDPGLRTGVKMAVVSATGQMLDHATWYPTPPHNKLAESAAALLQAIKKHGVNLIAIGNGTASRETEKFVKDALAAQPGLAVQTVLVNEAGASVYSASELAAKEFPQLDVSIRGAVSIARRLQDPLAELVKIDPKSIGVGQYQHDVSQSRLAKMLDAVVEDCVNAVGVEVNTASAALLSHVAGLNATIAQQIVDYRDQQGPFRKRQHLLKVPRLGPKAFEQAAGFLRIAQAENPLDASGVHPESYAVVKKIADQHRRSLQSLIGDSAFLRGLKAQDYTGDGVGEPTVVDILRELEKPGRDPRPEFKTARLKDGVEKIGDLQPGMVLEGTVTNVTHFGAFVDLGVHQDGLVHISALSHQFIKDPHSLVKAGDIVQVKVMEVDVARKRIALSMRLDDTPGAAENRPGAHQNSPGAHQNSPGTRTNSPGRPDAAAPREKRAQQRDEQQKGGAPGTLAALLTQALQKPPKR